MAHHFRPLHDRVLLKRVEVEDKTPAGVVLPKEKMGRYRSHHRGPRPLDDGIARYSA